jgi:hypothetical protein
MLRLDGRISFLRQAAEVVLTQVQQNGPLLNMMPHLPGHSRPGVPVNLRQDSPKINASNLVTRLTCTYPYGIIKVTKGDDGDE